MTSGDWCPQRTPCPWAWILTGHGTTTIHPTLCLCAAPSRGGVQERQGTVLAILLRTLCSPSGKRGTEKSYVLRLTGHQKFGALRIITQPEPAMRARSSTPVLARLPSGTCHKTADFICSAAI